MHYVNLVVFVFILLNTIAAIFTVLRRKRDIATTWAWLLVLIFLPYVGFVIYLFAGRSLSTKRMQQLNQEYARGVRAYTRQQHLSPADQDQLNSDMGLTGRELARSMWRSASAPLAMHNAFQLFTEGNAKFAALLADIDAAQVSIAVEYYTIYPDAIGTELRTHLIAALKRGVRVNVIYDAWGSLGMRDSWWSEVRSYGGQVVVFFSSKHIFTDFRLNYRDHRKIVVIDDAIAYTGGFNVGDQYLGRSAKFGNWRDTHARLEGDVVTALKIRFVMDWNATDANRPMPYPPLGVKHDDLPLLPMQVVASGPDTPQPYVKLAYAQLIMAARRRVWIQTPYLVPDETIMNALIGAATAGVDVRIMIPNMPDHPFIYRATQYYAKQLHEAGVHILHYQNGFLHAKSIICDDEVAGFGSTNCDYRSFQLNFEVTTFVYGKDATRKFAGLFTRDMQQSHLLTDADIDAQGGWLRFKQQFAHMLAPIL
ncbi:cardiolipin synthase [Lacticaseibacillus pabuli]|uniref:Cardiolipin synthase n=1 Tax=Lacticaseibacillus pabuli TaxID=3025672 RepID=A0ABY7WMU5_9LACO|nr:cardiolipin synthase [Lacticaseibacillus sp. KACC 23028]WDF81524.1 cardiolipin synthase [Lacticaseibacillus sp. KACC 23028]